MSKLTFLKQTSLDRLQANINANQHRYSENAPWLSSYFSGTSWLLESNVLQAPPFQLQIPTSKTELFDLENTRIVYDALRHLTPLQASNARIWAHMTHVTHWEYMRKRWPIEQYLGKQHLRENIQERYFFMPNRSPALIRNGMARLWWYGYCSYDKSREDPYELTTALLKTLDVSQSILERAFSLNTNVTKAVLGVLLEREKTGKAFYVREKVRDLAKYIVQIGGVTIIDALEEPDLRNLVEEKIEQLAAA
jgi:Family of unknown function (DUF6339)